MYAPDGVVLELGNGDVIVDYGAIIQYLMHGLPHSRASVLEWIDWVNTTV